MMKANLSKYYSQDSERLSFRKMTMKDLSDWVIFFQNNEREAFLGLDQNLSATEKAQQWIQLQLDRYAADEFGHLAIIEKSSGKLVGVSGLLVRIKEGHLDYEVAYSILPEFWGMGYATEAAKKMKKFATENQLHSRVVSWIHPENIYSQNVAKKNGMTFEGEEIEFRGIQVQVWFANI